MSPPTFVEVNLDAPCWLWPGAIDKGGYGKWKHHGAHRELWERLFGELPDNIHLDHLCHNPPCVNPAHMEPVTPGENFRRRLVLPQDLYATHCKHGHERTVENTRIRPDGTRECRVCKRIRWHRLKDEQATA